MTGRCAAGLLVVLLAASCAPAPPPATPYALVLGTAQDGGIPHAACTCSRCERARREPVFARRVASLAIVVPSTGKRFVIDATPDFPEQLDRLTRLGRHTTGGVDRAPLDGILLTHAHVGHYLGLAYLGFEAVHTSKLPVWATPRMAAFLAANAPWSRLIQREEIAIREAPPEVAFELDPGITVTPFAVPHRDEDSDTVAFKIQGPRHAIFYVPDTDTWSTWSDTVRAALASCDTALIDGTFYAADELPDRDTRKIGHPLITSTMDVLGPRVRAGSLKVLFTHLNHSNGALDPLGDQRRAIEAHGFAVAEEGQRLPL